MRKILLNWLLKVGTYFKLQKTTLFLAVSIIDRFISKREIKKTEYQKYGTAALFIASKFQEIYPPRLRYFLHICDNNFNSREFLEAEFQILSTLDFKVLYGNEKELIDCLGYIYGIGEGFLKMANKFALWCRI